MPPEHPLELLDAWHCAGMAGIIEEGSEKLQEDLQQRGGNAAVDGRARAK